MTTSKRKISCRQGDQDGPHFIFAQRQKHHCRPCENDRNTGLYGFSGQIQPRVHGGCLRECLHGNADPSKTKHGAAQNESYSRVIDLIKQQTAVGEFQQTAYEYRPHIRKQPQEPPVKYNDQHPKQDHPRANICYGPNRIPNRFRYTPAFTAFYCRRPFTGEKPGCNHSAEDLDGPKQPACRKFRKHPCGDAAGMFYLYA